jgi:type IV secretion system protein VirB4
VLRGFVDRTDRVLQLVEGFMPECRWLDDGETLTYLHALRLDQVPPRSCPRDSDVSRRVAGRSAADRRALSRCWAANTCACSRLSGFPTSDHAGILDDLNRLAFPYRWSTRAIMLDKADATKLLTRIRRQWFAKRKSVAAILKEVMTNEASSLIDTDASNKAIDADACVAGARLGSSRRAVRHRTITVWDENPRIADERLRLVEKVIQGRDFTSDGRDRQRGRCLAGLVARPRLCQRPPAARSRP